MKKLCLLLGMILISYYGVAQSVCETLLKKGITLYEAKNYSQAKVCFDYALKQSVCNDRKDEFQSWLKKCEEAGGAVQTPLPDSDDDADDSTDIAAPPTPPQPKKTADTVSSVTPPAPTQPKQTVDTASTVTTPPAPAPVPTQPKQTVDTASTVTPPPAPVQPKQTVDTASTVTTPPAPAPAPAPVQPKQTVDTASTVTPPPAPAPVQPKKTADTTSATTPPPPPKKTADTTSVAPVPPKDKSRERTVHNASNDVILLAGKDTLIIYSSDFPVNDKKEAVEVCKMINRNKAMGYNNWRIPTKDELQLIYSYRKEIKDMKENAKYLYDNDKNEKLIFNNESRTIADNIAPFYLRPVYTVAAAAEAANNVSETKNEVKPVKQDEPAQVLDISECITVLTKAMDTNPSSWWESGNRYKGQKKDDSRNGLGVFYYHSTGDFYFGDFKDGHRDGTGIYIKMSSHCKFYVGQWAANKKSGKGACYDNTGTLNYYGNFTEGNFTGGQSAEHDAYKFTALNYPGGDKYLGETKNGVVDGYGVYIWGNGDMWFGQWKDGKRAGRGVVINNEGVVASGIWDGETYQSESNN
jgi:hypothetical protein